MNMLTKCILRRTKWKTHLNFQQRGVATIIDGKEISHNLLDHVGEEVRKLRDTFGKEGTPSLAVVMVGKRPESAKYVEAKKRAAEKVGIRSIEEVLPEDCSHQELLETVRVLNQNKVVDGILVQLPLPKQCDQKGILEAIASEKDVDGFHPKNMGALARLGEDLRHIRERFDPFEIRNASCTPLAALALLEKSGTSLEGKHAVVLGRSNIVGLPAALMLLHQNATVTVCHSKTKDLEGVCRTGDVLIAALGRPEIVRGSWIKPGATVIDVGINFVEDSAHEHGFKMVGDVCFEEAKQVAGAITPVPGGVGPMTVAMLMMNTLNNAKKRLFESRNTHSITKELSEFSKSSSNNSVKSEVEMKLERKAHPIRWKFEPMTQEAEN